MIGIHLIECAHLGGWGSGGVGEGKRGGPGVEPKGGKEWEGRGKCKVPLLIFEYSSFVSRDSRRLSNATHDVTHELKKARARCAYESCTTNS